MKKCIALILALFMFLPGAVAESNPEKDAAADFSDSADV